jgi:uncharacterized protein YbjT (DUF2867 family)
MDAFFNAGFAVRNLVRTASGHPVRRGIEHVEFDLDQPSTYRPALEAVNVLALVTPADPRQTERELGLIDAAKASGVRRILNLSVIGADLPHPISAFARWQTPVEAALREAGIPHVTLRPNAFMQNILLQTGAIDTGVYMEPTGAMGSSLIDVRDIAAVAVSVAHGSHDGRALVLTGSEVLSGAAIAEILSAATGKQVSFVSPPIAAFRTALLDRGAPVWRADALTELYDAIQGGRAGHTAHVSPEVERITGRPPRTLRDFARQSFRNSAVGRDTPAS